MSVSFHSFSRAGRTRRRTERPGRRRPLVEALEQKALLAAGSVLDGFLTGPNAGDPLDIARAYLAGHGGDYGLSGDDLARMVVTDRYTDSQVPFATHIYLEQGYNGLSVLGQDLNVTVAADGSIVAIVGQGFLPALGQQPSADAPPAPAVSALQAVRSLAKELDFTLTTDPAVTAPGQGVDQATTIVSPDVSLDPIVARLDYVAGADGAPALAWTFVARTPVGIHDYSVQVDASTGAVLSQVDRVDWYSESYNVYAWPTRSPDFGGRQTVVNPNDPTASPYGWLDTDGKQGAESTLTIGNNVNAYEDSAGNNQVGFQPDGGANHVFDFPLDLTQAPGKYQAAAITDLFYWTNFSHDFHYQYGFTEAAGNYQTNNYGKGGVGKDAVLAQAQEGAGINNAYFIPAPDGSPGITSMFLFNVTSPERDGDLDPEIMLHEYGHGVSTRLTGGPSRVDTLDSVQAGGMGEGWSDFWSTAVLQAAGDDKNTPRPQGTYVLGEPTSGGGVRRFPYSYDMSINPETIADFNLDRSDNGAPEVHNTGELWAQTLLDMYWNLTDKYGYDSDLLHGHGGNNLAFQLVMEGLKLQPANPSFSQARDAILRADQVLTGGENQADIWQAFARRGMGLSFKDGGTNSITVTPATDLPAFLTVTATAPTGATENATFTAGALATITDPGGNNQATDYLATIDWGDGTTPMMGTVTANGNNTYTVSASHLFQEGGTYRAKVTVRKSGGGGVASATTDIKVADLPMTSSGVAVTGTEGQAITAVFASFNDTDPDTIDPSAYSATIDWGDGTTSTGQVVAAAGHNAFQVRATHAFGGTAAGSPAQVEVMIKGPGGGTTAATSTATIADTALTITPAAGQASDGTTFTGVRTTEGQPFSGVVATFVDADPRALTADYYAATIDWGDGSAPTTGTIAPRGTGGFSISGGHTYKIGNYTIKVSLKDGDVTTAQADVPSEVDNAAISAKAKALTLPEGVMFQGVIASFIDANGAARGGDYAATINWGDGSAPTAGRVSYEGDHTFVILGAHAFAAGSHPIAVHVTEPTLPPQAPDTSFTIMGSAAVSYAPLAAGSAPASSAVAGVATMARVATFRSVNPNSKPGDFAATIDWGDGSAPVAGTIQADPAGGFSVTGGHTYAGTGTYPIGVTISGPGGQVASTGSSAVVADAPISAGGLAISGNERSPFSGVVAMFRSANPFATAGQFRASINWGDGSTTDGTVTATPGGGFLVSGGHTYAQGGSYPLGLSIVSAAGSTATAAGSASVADKLYGLSGGLSPTSDSGASSFDGITNVRTPTFLGGAEAGAVVTLYAMAPGGGPVPIGTGRADGHGAWSVTTRSLPDGSYSIFASATDSGGRPSSPVTQLLPTAGHGPLVIDTAAPQITASALDPRTGQVVISFQDGSGLDARSLASGAAYGLARLNRLASVNLPLTGLSVAPVGPTDALQVTATFNGGRPLSRGGYLLSVKSAGLTDLAGNTLVERHFVEFPTAVGQVNTDYIARFTVTGSAPVGPQQYVPQSEALGAAAHQQFIRSRQSPAFTARAVRTFRVGRGR